MKHCESIDMEVTPTGAILRGLRWPEEISVDRNLLDYLPGPHVSFGRYGVLRFNALNGYAVYRRFEDVPGGWNYRLVENQLKAEVPEAGPAEPHAPKAERRYRAVDGRAIIDAFQWLPHAVPPVMLPEWFIRSDFEHSAAGDLTIRSGGKAMKAQPSDWIVRKIHGPSVVPAVEFVQHYTEAA
jgi:hypothetical protein